MTNITKLKIGALLLISLLLISTAATMTVADEKRDQIKKLDILGGTNSDDVQFAQDGIIVKFKAGTSDETISEINSKNKVESSERIIKKNLKAVENKKTKIFKKHGLERIYLLKLPQNSDVNKMVRKYNEYPDVEYSEPNYKVYVDATIPDDYYFSLQWGMNNKGQDGGTVDADIDAPEAWDITTGSSDIVVAVIDTGVDYNHEDLDANMWTNPDESINGVDDDGNGYIDDIRGWDFLNNDNDPYDDIGHGTHCSGTIAAEGNNGMGVVGVSRNSKIMALKFLGPEGGTTLDAILAINYAIDNGADIISNSWGGEGNSMALKNAISTANDAGILFVAAAGNGGVDNDVKSHYPSNYVLPNVVSVAASDRYDNPASFSNYGLISVDLYAPGVTIASTYPSNIYKYVRMSGTSMAAPHVAGAAALIMAQNPEISVADLKARILDSVDPIDILAGKTVTGGRLNVFNCLEANTEPQLSITVTSTASTVNVGNSFNVDAMVSNLGDETATDVEAKITLPGGLSTADTLTKTADDISGTDLATVSWNVNADAEGTYTITVESSAANAASASGTTTVDVVTPDTEKPIITDITRDTSTSTGDSVDIVVTAIDNVDPTLASIFIDNDANGIEMTENPDDTFTYTYTAPSDSVANHTYDVMVYDDADNFVTSGTYTITVTDNDAPTADAGQNQIVLVNEVVTFDGSASSDNIGITDHSWDYDAIDGIQVNATGVMATHTYTATGTYTVTLTVKDAAGNQDLGTLTVTVNEPSAEVVVFQDSYEAGLGYWVQDTQNDWFTSAQRATDGTHSVEVDGRAIDATLTMAYPIDLSGKTGAALTFDWFIEGNWDDDEYIKLEIFDGSKWIEEASIDGTSRTYSGQDENQWLNEEITLGSKYMVQNFKIRFKARVSSSKEDGNVDNVKII